MQPPVAAPAPTLLVVKALRQALGPMVSTVKPTKPPDRFVVISRIGADAPTFATIRPRYLVECYAAELEAEQFAEDVAHAWRRLREHNPTRFGHGYTDSVIPFDDPDVSHVRFQFTAGTTVLLNS